jgi:hypothetical protein
VHPTCAETLWLLEHYGPPPQRIEVVPLTGDFSLFEEYERRVEQIHRELSLLRPLLS